MDSQHPYRCLVVFMRQRLTMAWAGDDPGESLQAEGIRYVSKVDSDFTGFYNRLYVGKEFVGLQVQLLLGEHYLPIVMAGLPYVRRVDSAVLRLFLRGAVVEDVVVADDQGFGGRIYESIEGKFAMSFDTEWMSETDLAALKGAPAVWLPIASVTAGG